MVGVPRVQVLKGEAESLQATGSPTWAKPTAFLAVVRGVYCRKA